MTTPTVFVVDDDASVRTALTRLLASAGVRVEVFADAAELLARAPSGEHGCILLDIRMPGVTGLDLQPQLKDHGIDVPVIFLSAHADVPLAVRAMKDGALDVLRKPFRERTLLATVRQALAVDEERRRARDEHDQTRRRFESLTPREKTVMRLVVAGKLNKQTAELIGTSVKTVKVHRAHVMAKMQAASLPDLVRMADALCLLDEVSSPSPGVPKVQ